MIRAGRPGRSLSYLFGRLAPALTAAGIVFALALAHAHQATSTSADRGSSLVAAARSLLPPGARILRQEPGRCVELAPYPSCVTILFANRRGSFRQRQRRAAANARAHGWLVRVQVLPAGTMIWVERRKLWGFISLRPDSRSKCGDGETLMQCLGHVDNLQVKSA